MKPSEIIDRARNIALIESMLTDKEESRDRHEAILNNPNLAKRLGALAMHRAVHLVGRERVRGVIERPYRQAGIKVLGHGYTATVILGPDGENVLKVMRGSDQLDEKEREELARVIESKILPNKTAHPEVAIPTTVTVGPSPVNGRPIVQVIQPFVPRTPDELDPREVRDFAEKSLEEMKPGGFLPDVYGRDNLINTEDGLRLIDTVAISRAGREEDTFNKCTTVLEQMARTGTYQHRLVVKREEQRQIS